MDVNEVMRENQKLKKERDEFEFENKALMDAVDFLTEALLWTSQADDFKEGGRARDGWEKIDIRVSKERDRVKKLKENRKYWNIK